MGKGELHIKPSTAQKRQEVFGYCEHKGSIKNIIIIPLHVCG